MAVHHPGRGLRTPWGEAVLSPAGHPLGRVEDLLVDARSGNPQWVVVRLRGLLPRHRALPLALLRRAPGGFVVPVSRRSLRDSPRVVSGVALTARQELALYVYWAAEY
jgi:hypothetical protein